MTIVNSRRFRFWSVLALALAAVSVVPTGASASEVTAAPRPAAGSTRSGVYGGGPFYDGGQTVMDDLRSSGFTTVVLWTIHVNSSSGDLAFNDHVVVSNGQYVGDPGWGGRLRSLKQAP